MTRREAERVAAAVEFLRKEGERTKLPISPGRISQIIGRAVLGAGASKEVWTKWLLATGWPKEIAADMAHLEATRQLEGL